MRTKKFKTRLKLDSNFENHDIELKKYFKTNCLCMCAKSKQQNVLLIDI